MKYIRFAALAFLLVTQHSFAGGVGLSTTRVIYDGSKKEASLTVENHNEKEEYLIQSWIDDINGNKKTPFVITPPLFKLDPKKITYYVLLTLKIFYHRIVNLFSGLM